MAFGPHARCCLTSWPAAQARTPGWTATPKGCGPQLGDLDTIGYLFASPKTSAWRCRIAAGAPRHPAVAEYNTRPGGQWGGAYGTMSMKFNLSSSFERALVKAERPLMTHAIRPVDFDNLKTMTCEVTGRIARDHLQLAGEGQRSSQTPCWGCLLWWSVPIWRACHSGVRSRRDLPAFDSSAYAEGSSPGKRRTKTNYTRCA